VKPDASRATRRSLAGAGYAVSFMLAPVSGSLTSYLFSRPLEAPLSVTLLTSAVLVTILIIQIVLALVAEGFLVPSCRDVSERDPRAPVLFLRPFGEDEPLTYDVISAGETTTTILAKAEDFLLALNAVGPLISIAEPAWSSRLGLHPPGAFRDYVDPSQWQRRVEQLLDQAGMVVLAVGESPGIEWEIAQVCKRIGPQSLLVYLAPRPASALTQRGRSSKERAIYEHFAPMIRRHFAIELPPFSESLHIIGFDTSGAPIVAPEAVRSRWTLSEQHRVANAITSQLKAVLARTRPGIDLDHYRVPGRAAAWWPIGLATVLFLTAIGLGFWASLRT
jgi:hypothetical protein